MMVEKPIDVGSRLPSLVLHSPPGSGFFLLWLIQRVITRCNELSLRTLSNNKVNSELPLGSNRLLTVYY
jgi:hypothetical protein